jgi:hypothetical protein
MPSWNADRCAVRSDPDILALLFDDDGAPVGSVYQHVSAWREATQAADIELPVHSSSDRHEHRLDALRIAA